jgi:hypothetical protein
MLETTELGLGESQELNAVGRGAGMLMDGTNGMSPDIGPPVISEGIGELVEECVLLASPLSSIALREAAAEVCSYGLPDGPRSAATTSGSEMPS